MGRLKTTALLAGCMVTMLFSSASSQTTAAAVQGVLDEHIQVHGVTAFQAQRYLVKRIPLLVAPSSSDQWRAEEVRIRRHILSDIVFHGWPQDWISESPRFDQTGVIENDKGYRLRKFRYQVVPEFYSAAILYEPTNIQGRSPAILNVIGHEIQGNAAEYEQKRCINFTKRGIFALSLSWPGFGQLAQPANAHDYAADLDLVGANALGFFYLSMLRGLDYLSSLPQVDVRRLGVTGLSGGGWQTTILGALDQRVAVSVEVAGIGALESNLVRPRDTDEIEENATDLTRNEDYPWFVAIRAPRPTLLIHNAEDDCCFRADLVKPYIYDRVLPFFELFGNENDFGWHENRDPGTHNYQLDNREQAYAFFTKHFGLPMSTTEIPTDGEIRTADQLAVDLPQQNLTILGLARRLAALTARAALPSNGQRAGWTGSERERLKQVVRYSPVTLANVWRVNNTKERGLETLSYRFDFSNGLSASGIWLKAISAPAQSPAIIILGDKGYKGTAELVSDHVNRGEQVLALDVIFNGDSAPDFPADWEMLVSTTGDRPLGIEAAQLLAVAQWLGKNSEHNRISIVTDGMRSQVMAVTAAALQPDAFTTIEAQHSIGSLGYLLKNSVPFRSAPELFCLDLYRYFDLDNLSVLAHPTDVKRNGGDIPFEKGDVKKYQ